MHYRIRETVDGFLVEADGIAAGPPHVEVVDAIVAAVMLMRDAGETGGGRWHLQDNGIVYVWQPGEPG